MRNNRIQLTKHITLWVLTACFLGCYATTHRGPQTLKPGDFSASGGYLRFTDSEDSGGDPGELIQVEGRIGVADTIQGPNARQTAAQGAGNAERGRRGRLADFSPLGCRISR